MSRINPDPIKRLIQTVYTHGTHVVTCEHTDPRSNNTDLDAIDLIPTGTKLLVDIGKVVVDNGMCDLPVRRTFVSIERHIRASVEALSNDLE